MIDQHIQRMQNDVHSLLMAVPDGTTGRKAITLAWESLRLAWYMYREDGVGISEKKYYVRLAFDRLMEEFEEETPNG